MQDPSLYQQMNPQFPEQLKCPRCDSTNTKFCYYNNYNLSQPRHYCKNCRRYWTKGGTLRNIPVGGGTRNKNTKRSSSSSSKRNSSSSSSPPSSSVSNTNTSQKFPKSEPSIDTQSADHNGGMMFDAGGNNYGQFRSLLEGFSSSGFVKKSIFSSGSEQTLTQNSGVEMNGDNNNGQNFTCIGNERDSSCWGNNNAWPDLAIYTPGSTFK